MSRNRIPTSLLKLFNFSKAEIKEYTEAKDENEVVQLIIRDAKGKGCKLEQDMEVNNEKE